SGGGDETGRPGAGGKLWDHPRRQCSERDVVAAVQRKVVNRPAADHLPQGRRFRLEQGCDIADNGKFLGNLAYLHRDIDDGALGNVQRDVFDDRRLESDRSDVDAIAAGRELWNYELAGAVGDRFTLLAGGGQGGSYLGLGYGRSGGVGHYS